MDELAQQRIDGIRAVWSAGSYEAVGDLWASVGAEVAAELDDRVGLAGRVVLDAACGTGNTTLALARHGAVVTGMDLTPHLLAVATRRAAAEDLPITWREGDLVDLPFPDDSFDVVTSTFGAFLVDDPWRCAAELARVCRSGGTIAVTAWGRSGPFGRIRELMIEQFPVLAEQPRPDTAAWAEADGLAERFDGTGAELTDLDVRTVGLPFASVDAALAFMLETSGPFQMIRAAVEGVGGDWDAFAREVVAAWEPISRPSDDGVVIDAPWARALLTVS